MLKDNTVMQGDKCSYCGTNKCLSWSGVVAGALVGLGLSFLFNLFDMSIGLTAFDTSKEGLTAIAIGSYVGLVIGSIVSMFMAGYVAGYFGRKYTENRRVGVLYGFTTWCLALVLLVLLGSQIGQFATAAHDRLSNPNVFTMSASNQTASNAKEEASSVASKTVQKAPGDTSLEKASSTFGLSLFLTFVLFFIGAVSSCFGGYCGIKRKDTY